MRLSNVTARPKPDHRFTPMKTTDIKSELSRARNLLEALKSSVRWSLSAQILLGRELAFIKKKLGFTPGGDRKGSSHHSGDLIRSWPDWLKQELGISPTTAVRYVACFEYARGRANAHKAKAPEAFRLLETSPDLSTEDDWHALAEHLEGLVKGDDEANPLTQAQIMEELGMVKPSNKIKGGDTSGSKKPVRQMTLAEWAKESFEKIPMKFDDLESEIFRIKGSPLYTDVLKSLELDSPDAVASLMGIKEGLQRVLDQAKACLERVLKGDLAKMMETVEVAIAEKMHGTPPKRSRRNLATSGSK